MILSTKCRCSLFYTVLSVRFEVGVSLLQAPAGADKRGPMAHFPLVENAGIQPAICKRVPAGAPAGAGGRKIAPNTGTNAALKAAFNQ